MLGLWAGGVADPVEQAEEALAIAREVDDPALLVARAHCVRLHQHARRRVGSAVLHRGDGSRPGSIDDNGGCARFSVDRRTERYSSGDFVDAESIAREGMELADALGDPSTPASAA